MDERDERQGRYGWVRRARAWAAGLLAAGLAYTAGLGLERQDAASHGARSYRAPAARRAVGAFASARVGDGRPWSLAGERGRVVLVHFFATWCPPCRAETPDLARAARRYGPRGLEVVGVDMDGGGESAAAAAVAAYAREYGVPYPLLTAAPLARPMRALGLLGGDGGMALPTSVFVDRQGRVASVQVGALSREALSAEIERLLSEGAAGAGAPSR